MRLVLKVIPLLAQGNPGDALTDLIALAGILIVPCTFFVVLFWFKKGRPTSSAVMAGLVLIFIVFLVWGVAFFGWLTKPSVDEEMAVEEMESAYPILDKSTWSYSAQHPSIDVWIITVKGHDKGGEAVDKTFRVNSFSVQEKQPDDPSGWRTLKRWPPADALHHNRIRVAKLKRELIGLIVRKRYRSPLAEFGQLSREANPTQSCVHREPEQCRQDQPMGIRNWPDVGRRHSLQAQATQSCALKRGFPEEPNPRRSAAGQ